jgi:hypothetical protein
MPKSIGEFFNELALKAGFPVDDETLKNVLSAPDLQKIMVPDEVVTRIDNGLLSVTAAKNNHPDIKKHYTATVLNGLDSELNTLMEELQIPDDVKNVILNERNSFKRAAVLTRKVKELEQAKKSTGDKDEKSTLQKTINELNDQIRVMKEGEGKIKTDYEGKIRDITKQTKLEAMFANYKTVYDDLPAEARTAAINALVTKTLQDKDAKLEVDENGKLVLLRKDGANVFGDNNVQLDPQKIIDLTLSNNKLLKVTDTKTDASSNTDNNNNNNNQRRVITGNDNNNGNDSDQFGNPLPKKNSVLKSLVSTALADIDAAAKQG